VSIDFEGAIVHSKVAGYPLTRDASVRDKSERLMHVAKFVIEGVRQNSFSVVEPGGRNRKPWVVHPRVVIEGYAYGKGGRKKKSSGKDESPISTAGAVFDLAELGGVVKTQLLLTFNISAYVVATSSARKAVVDNGRASKAQVKKVLDAREIFFEDHNMRDAYVTAECLRLRDDVRKAG